MQPSALLKEASKSPDKFGIDDYRDTIWLLRNKGNSWREIADFLNSKGVKTDHARVFRIIMAGNPLFDFDDAGVIHGNIVYESRKGRPLRPFRAGLYINIKERVNCIMLENSERIHSVWCECQFTLSGVPNQAWIQQLHKELDANWNSDAPYYLKSKHGFELKFEGDLMALVCPTYQLKESFELLVTAIEKVSKFFQENKSWWEDLNKRKRARKKKIFAQYQVGPGETIDDVCETHSGFYADQMEELKKKFNALPL
jgi:hypothetical protein